MNRNNEMSEKIIDRAKNIDTSVSVVCKEVTSFGEIKEKSAEIVCERYLSVAVNGQQAFYLSCTPDKLTELVLGRLYTENLIKSMNEVKKLYICENGTRAEVLLDKNIELVPYNGAEPTCCTGNKQLLAPAYSDEENEKSLKEPIASVPLNPEHIFALAEYFRKDGEIHKSTGGTHSCYIRFGNGEILSFEDISRHNAIDKAVGAMLLRGEKPEQCMIYTTGRIAADMVIKTAAAHIPILISKAVPTDEALKLAKEKQLTLICRAWPDSYTVYNS